MVEAFDAIGCYSESEGIYSETTVFKGKLNVLDLNSYGAGSNFRVAIRRLNTSLKRWKITFTNTIVGKFFIYILHFIAKSEDQHYKNHLYKNNIKL